MDIRTFYKQKIYPNLYAIEQKMIRIPYHHLPQSMQIKRESDFQI